MPSHPLLGPSARTDRGRSRGPRSCSRPYPGGGAGRQSVPRAKSEITCGVAVSRGIARGHVRRRVRQPQQVAVGDALAPAVLDRLVGERLHRLGGVPAADRSAQRAAPAAETLDERREPEHVRAGARHPWQRREGRLPRHLVAEAGRHRQREDRRIVLRRPALVADAHDLGHRARPVLGQAALDRLRVLARERPPRGVVGAALRAEDQEAAQPRPVVDRPGEAPRAVRHLARARDRHALRHAPRAVPRQVGHLPPPFSLCASCGSEPLRPAAIGGWRAPRAAPAAPPRPPGRHGSARAPRSASRSCGASSRGPRPCRPRTRG
jgi:hypothetical protein